MKWMVPTIAVMMVLLFLDATSVTAENISNYSREECLTKNGEWIEPINVDVREGDARVAFCRCPTGFFLNESKCWPIHNESLCLSSDGTWINDSCACPNNSVGFVKNIGCDYLTSVETVQLELNKSGKIKEEGKTNLFLLLSMLIIIATIILYTSLRRKKNE